MGRPDRAFGIAVGVMLWLVGLLLALMTGMLSAYLILTGVYVGSRVAALVRARGMDEIRKTIRGGDPG